MAQQTFTGTKLKALRKSGFRVRSKSKNGRKILKNRRKKNRKNLALSKK